MVSEPVVRETVAGARLDELGQRLALPFVEHLVDLAPGLECRLTDRRERLVLLQEGAAQTGLVEARAAQRPRGGLACTLHRRATLARCFPELLDRLRDHLLLAGRGVEPGQRGVHRAATVSAVVAVP